MGSIKEALKMVK